MQSLSSFVVFPLNLSLCADKSTDTLSTWPTHWRLQCMALFSIVWKLCSAVLFWISKNCLISSFLILYLKFLQFSINNSFCCQDSFLSLLLTLTSILSGIFLYWFSLLVSVSCLIFKMLTSALHPILLCVWFSLLPSVLIRYLDELIYLFSSVSLNACSYWCPFVFFNEHWFSLH